ncbi:MAG: hypothetical protein KAT46_06290 [Deltaproteobacteria bacterium]|nr:hypothetical protein [Deltaproteobacteria bacterium]
MGNNVNIKIKIPSAASSKDSEPFMEHERFLKYCKANHVRAPHDSLEKYEKNGLLYPCVRVLSPRELLRRIFRADYSKKYPGQYNVRKEWLPLVDLDKKISMAGLLIGDELIEAIEFGHPLERAIESKNVFLFDFKKHKFKAWKSYKVIEGESGGVKLFKSRAKHYYSPWKIFHLDDLGILNTVKSNRVTGVKSGWGAISQEIYSTKLTEFDCFFKVVASFSYRRSLLRGDYNTNSKRRRVDRDKLAKVCVAVAKDLTEGGTYKEWVRFLRKLIEIHELYRSEEKILLSLEAKAWIVRTVILLRNAKKISFEQICDDVSGFLKGKSRLGNGLEDGVVIHPGRLEEMFPDETYDVEENIGWMLEGAFEHFNKSLSKDEHLPSGLWKDLLDELKHEPTGTVLHPIRKMHATYFGDELWRDDELWDAITRLTIVIEEYGGKWIGKKKKLDGIFKTFFKSEYEKLQRQVGGNVKDASDTKEFLEKLKKIQTSNGGSFGKRCGGHILVTCLVRNFSAHGGRLKGKHLSENLEVLYHFLLGTFFAMYACHENV